jgi:hypothetical protein
MAAILLRDVALYEKKSLRRGGHRARRGPEIREWRRTATVAFSAAAAAAGVRSTVVQRPESLR